MKKNKQQNGRLPREAVEFMHKLLESGVSLNLLNRLMPFDDEMSEKIEFALILGLFERIEREIYDYTSIAIGWKLAAQKSASFDLKLQQHHNSPNKEVYSCQHALNQMQPQLESTRVSVLKANQTKTGIKHLTELFNYKINGISDKTTNFLREHRIGLGIGHANEVVEEFSLLSRKIINSVTPLGGPEALGTSIFILLDYKVFSDFRDTVGIQTMGWWEIRVVDFERADYRLLSTVHTRLDPVIPRGSLIALGNLPWHKKLQ